MNSLENFLDFESWLYPKESIGEETLNTELLRRRFKSICESPTLMNIAWLRRELLKIAINTINGGNDEKNTTSNIEGSRGVEETSI